MTHQHEVEIDRISNQLFSHGLNEKLVKQWWQEPMECLNGYCALEAVCNDKGALAQMACDKYLRVFDKMVYELEDGKKAIKEILNEGDDMDVKFNDTPHNTQELDS